MFTILLRIGKTAYRLLLRRKRWRYDSIGYCTACGSTNIFIHDTELRNILTNITDPWHLSGNFKKQLLERENYACVYCLANYRQRVHAESVLSVLGLDKTAELVTKLKSNPTFSIYETAAYNVFRTSDIKKQPNYIVSEYYDNHPFGTYVNGVRNETLENLSFPDNSFDVLINSDVLEHVNDLDKSLSEIKRILKPGGFHVFTIPVDHNLPKTQERARILNEDIEYLMPPVMHVDSIRSSGVLVFRDFGNDILTYMSRDGLQCKEIKYHRNAIFTTSVYYAQKK